MRSQVTIVMETLPKGRLGGCAWLLPNSWTGEQMQQQLLVVPLTTVISPSMAHARSQLETGVESLATPQKPVRG